MMEHIRQFDWCALQPNNQSFVTECGLDNCVTEKILQNKFCNPLLSSDSEDEGTGASKFDWNQIFKKRNNEQNYHRIFVPGLRPPPGFTRTSALTAQQHQQCLKVLCAKNPRILPDEFMPRPTKIDIQVFEDLKETYEKEQQEFIAWAKSLWTNGQCIRALRPSPAIETVYEAEFKVRANQMKGYPKVLEVVAQLPLDAPHQCDLKMLEELVAVNVSELPAVRAPDTLRQRLVLRPCPVPEPCDQHPVPFILPNEESMSVLPITEVHRELAEYAARHDSQFIASEGALRCLVERRAWSLPATVCHVAVAAADGGSGNVIVLGSEFSNKQENALTRTFRAYRHMLEFSLVPASEMSKRVHAGEVARGERPAAAPAPAPAAAPAPAPAPAPASAASSSSAPASSASASAPAPAPASDSDDDDADDNLFIDFGIDEQDSLLINKVIEDDDCSIRSAGDHEMEVEEDKQRQTERTNLDKSIEGFGVYKCTCPDSTFELPPPRSFRKWKFRNKSTMENYDVIVHCAHKHRGASGEILLEPIPEYQADLGASKQSDDRINSLALSLALRDNASVLNVRIDAQSGDVITIEELSREQFFAQHGDRSAELARQVHAALNQLQGLVPGQYVIQHEPSYGDNVLLYAPRNTGGAQLRLDFDSTQLAEADEARNIKTPPQLTPTLLPWHKFRKILPCAFTHYQSQIVKPKKQPQRKKTPPRALKWPKKRSGRKPKTNEGQ